MTRPERDYLGGLPSTSALRTQGRALAAPPASDWRRAVRLYCCRASAYAYPYGQAQEAGSPGPGRAGRPHSSTRPTATVSSQGSRAAPSAEAVLATGRTPQGQTEPLGPLLPAPRSRAACLHNTRPLLPQQGAAHPHRAQACPARRRVTVGAPPALTGLRLRAHPARASHANCVSKTAPPLPSIAPRPLLQRRREVTRGDAHARRGRRTRGIVGAVVPRPGGPRTLRRAAGAHRVAAAAAAAAAAVVLHRAGPGRAGGAERRGCASPGLCAAGGGGAAGCGRWRRRRVKGNGGDGCYGVSWGQRRGGGAARREQEGPWRAVLGTRRERCDAGGRWEAQLGAHEAPSGGTGEQSCGDAMLGSAAGQGRPCGGAGKRHWGHRGGDAVLGGQRGRAGGHRRAGGAVLGAALGAAPAAAPTGGRGWGRWGRGAPGGGGGAVSCGVGLGVGVWDWEGTAWSGHHGWAGDAGRSVALGVLVGDHQY